ncbi:hypothetical protein SU69_07580 [Thermosipho melanesiensis]|uniref:tRNA threonylcarbamoyladenosine biosynthesis protein TsaE n=2 Tax=Thermosipho melanesiensis TaxID=46541 RepID=A6LN36_THEM4|nr:tRNA (adenosine(37)-N6)-threonylcarbamoyltransferase complex ATPase subunit type 1 TsaE [Thermosipho melanesiensis]ABR31337.1 protein of unknown function UPF0079 [Thermosipho melanesiensis BI429]APT74397.1 hypothetical protein BW47_07935 [Thermosipho melanesiensis]OOC36360.1 hypothetical protein SU68_07650 [Thermosipho melanesiensis]OOC37178.1 hypothetical protein SU69_07580 [Thermosipho melanesiensis]OOC37930.1 hypothetical protein SU70_07590 [Thermosipho melanesiensis]
MRVEDISLEELKTLANIIAKYVKSYDLNFIYLNGDLGTGKTTFTKYFCENFSVEPSQISSPTFSIVNVYNGVRTIYHVDLYRIGDIDEVFYVLEENFEDKEGIFIIEWSDLFKEYFTEKGIKINFYHKDEFLRDIDVITDLRSLEEDLRRWDCEREKV